jgi:acyl-coenzyme A thioesterase PaaI-like protein
MEESVKAEFENYRSEVIKNQYFENIFYKYAKFVSVSTEKTTSKIIFEIVVPIELKNLQGNLNGGALATIIDAATFLSVACLDRRTGSSLNLSVNYLSPIPVGSTIQIISNCHKIGKNIAFTTAEIWSQNKVVALGSHNIFLVSRNIFTEKL